MPRRALLAELACAALLLGYGWFSTYRLVLLLLLASQSLWIRGLGWSDLGLSRRLDLRRVLLQATVAAGAILLAVRFAIVPVAVRATGVPVDLSQLEPIRGDRSALWIWLAQAWTLASFGEEMVFRGYLIQRIADLVGRSGRGLSLALAISSVYFGWAHRYQGPAGMVATTSIGALIAVVYLRSRSLWTVIVCHGLVDTAALLAIYLGHESWVFG